MSKNTDDLPEKMQEALFTEILNRPENYQCADCTNKKPTWASINFGVFLCIRCSGIHRQLGPHITRVKSAKLDKWKRDHAEIMTSIGNKLANDFYEFKLPKDMKRLDVNSSPEECSRFVRDKYIKKNYAPTNFTDPVTELLLKKEKGMKVELVVPKENPAHKPEPQHSIKGPLVLRKKSFSIDDNKEESTPTNQGSSGPSTNTSQQQNQLLDLIDDIPAPQNTTTSNTTTTTAAPTTTNTNNTSNNTSSVFEFDFSAIHSTTNQSQPETQAQSQVQSQGQPQSQTQNVFGQFQQQQQQPENKAANPPDLKSLYQQSTAYNNPYGMPMNPMMMNNNFNPYMAQQQFNANAFPQQQMGGYPQAGGFPQMNQGYPNQFNNPMMMGGGMNPAMMNQGMQGMQGMQYQQNAGMAGGFSPNAYMQQGYNPQMMSGGFTQGMNNMQQQQAKPTNFF